MITCIQQQNFISIKAEVIAALEKVCGLYPSDIRDECKNLVEEHGQEIVDLLISELSPEQVCTKLSLCTSSLALEKVRIEPRN